MQATKEFTTTKSEKEIHEEMRTQGFYVSFLFWF